MSDESLHELLPWFLTGTLEAAEAEAFRRHLESCAGCRDEMEVLSKVRDAAEREGSAYMSAHPEAERLVAFVEGELEEAEAGEVRAHIALCSTCALESRWVAGDRVAGQPPESRGAPTATVAAPPRDRTANWWVMAGSAAAILLAAIALSVFFPRDRGPEIPRLFYLTGPDRTAGGQVLEHDCTRSLALILPVEVPPTAFPVSVEIIDDRGEALLREDGVSRDLLTEGLYLSVVFPAEACQSGDYRVRVTPVGAVPTEILFRIERP